MKVSPLRQYMILLSAFALVTAGQATASRSKQRLNVLPIDDSVARRIRHNDRQLHPVAAVDTNSQTSPAFATLEIFFGSDTEDVTILVQTLVSVDETPEIVYSKPYDSFPESEFQNTRFVETIAVEADVVYSLQIRQRNDAVGIESYSLYFGSVAEAEFLQFTDSVVNAFEGNYFSVESPPPTDAAETTVPPTTAPTSTQPITSPTPSPTVEPESPSGPSTCFSGRTYVTTKDRGYIRMEHLRVGDQVSIDSSDGDSESFSTVYAFGHRREKEITSFVQLLPSKLELSPSHMLHVQNGKGLVPAHMVELGDVLSDGRPVTEIRTVERVGLYNPFTVSGTISVNNIQCSNYIAFQNSPFLTIGTVVANTGLHYHTISHAALFPLRVWCHWFGFQNDFDEASGWSRWAGMLHWCLHGLLSIENDETTTIVGGPFNFSLGNRLMAVLLPLSACLAFLWIRSGLTVRFGQQKLVTSCVAA